METISPQTRAVIIYPDWDSQIHLLAEEFGSIRSLDTEVVDRQMKSYARKIRLVQQQIRKVDPIIAMGGMMKGEGHYTSHTDIASVLEKLRETRLGRNEFYVVYDAFEQRFTYVDPAVSDILGLTQDEFNLHALLGLHPEFNLAHPEDSANKIRWAGIAYLILSLPGFTFTSLREHYCISLRIDTSRSRREDLARAKSAMLTKKCYFVIAENEKPTSFPRYHINRVTVQDAANFDYVRPYFESDFVQSKYLNALAYLINCFLIGIDPKFIILLDEKSRQERNKAIAESINQKLERYTRIQSRYTENKVADCFAKTIRPKLQNAANSWLKPAKRIVIESDSDAVEYARRLGLLPVNATVLRMIFRLASER